MPKFAEVIYETGAHSIISIDDMDEFKAGLAEHHRRAMSGEPGAPQEQYGRNDVDPADFAVYPSLDAMKSRPAERIKRVFVYDQHPADLVPVGNDGTTEVDVDSVNELVSGMADTSSGKVNMHRLVQALRDEASPVYPVNQGRHESQYKMQGTELTDLGFLDGGDE